MDEKYEWELLNIVNGVRRGAALAVMTGAMHGKISGLNGDHVIMACFTGLVEAMHQAIETTRESYDEATPDQAERKKLEFDGLIRGQLQHLCNEFGYEVAFYNEVDDKEKNDGNR